MTPLDCLARRQYGCLRHRQILDFVSRHTMNRRIERGIYVPVQPRVVRLAVTRDTPTTRAWAASLAIGRPSAVAGMSAALLHGIPDIGDSGVVSLVVPDNRRAPHRPGLDVRRVTGWAERSWIERSGLQVASLADTVIDVAAALPPARVTRILEQLLWRRLTPEQIQVRLASGRAGSASIREALKHLSDGMRSVHERRVSAGLRRRRVPLFRTNHVLRDERGNPVAEIDFLWRELRVAVMIDGWRYHAQGTFQQDHDVPNGLVTGKDYVVLRFTGRDIEHRFDWVLDQIEVLLRRQAQRLGVEYAS